MKKLFIILIAGAGFALQSADAHSGRTDKNGGHYDHSTGRYHHH